MHVLCLIIHILSIVIEICLKSFFLEMEEQAVDSHDTSIGVNHLVFQNNQSERSSWKFCNSTTLPRSEVVFFFQAITLLILIITSLAKLVFYDVPCEDMPLWVSLLSAAVGYILPSPHL